MKKEVFPDFTVFRGFNALERGGKTGIPGSFKIRV